MHFFSVSEIIPMCCLLCLFKQKSNLLLCFIFWRKWLHLALLTLKKKTLLQKNAIWDCLIWEQQKWCDFQKSETSVPLKDKFLFSFCFPSTYKPHSLIRLLASLVSSNKKEWLIALGRTKSHRVAQLLTLLSQPLTYKSCSDSCPCGGRGPTDGRHSAHSPADINSSQSSHSI